IQDGGTGIHNYSVGEEYKVDADETIIKKDELTQDGIVKWLNNDRSESACVAGIAKSLLCDWEYNENTGAVLVRK
ncbi:MAG: hypothetical protein IJZ20_03815, partial [Clostridia bacterium]|nr:hypothetical protein [Clostridia bacterium]